MEVVSSTTRFITARTLRGSMVFTQSRVSTLFLSIWEMIKPWTWIGIRIRIRIGIRLRIRIGIQIGIRIRIRIRIGIRIRIRIRMVQIQRGLLDQ